jgi:hypothetical protein
MVALPEILRNAQKVQSEAKAKAARGESNAAQPVDSIKAGVLVGDPAWPKVLECIAKPSLQIIEADERAAQMEERLMDVVPPLVAHRKPTVA